MNRYKNRTKAGLVLAKKLAKYKNKNAVVVAIPRGGVPIGKIIAEYLNLPLEVELSKKIGHPFQPEYAIGAVSLDTRILEEGLEIPQKYIDEETEKIREMLRQRFQKYSQGRPRESLVGKIVIIVDDGIATGLTIESTVDLVAKHQPQKIVIAVPVAPSSSLEKLENNKAVDEIICPLIPLEFVSVGRFYEKFPQVSDEEVVQLLSAKPLPK